MEFSRDKYDYDAFPEDLKQIVDSNFAFFSFADGRVIENIVFRLMLMNNTVEQRLFYGVQIFIEQVHSEFYSKTIEAVIPDPDKRDRLFKALDDMPIMKRKDDWMTSYMQVDMGPGYVILPYTCVEGIFFQAGFVFILWFKVIGKMDNVVFGNIQVRKDEALHRNFGIYKYGQLSDEEKPTEAHAYRIITEAVELEIEYTDYVTPKIIEYRANPESEFPDATLDPADVKEYIRLTADHLLISLGYEAKWHVDPKDLPPWLYEIAMETKNNFYEIRGGNYSKFSTKDLYMGHTIDDVVTTDNAYVNPEAVDF